MTRNASIISIEPAAPDSPEAAACLNAYFTELATRFEGGFDPEAGAASPDTAMAPPAGAFLIAWLDGRAVGCGGVKLLEPGIGEIKRMWIAPDVRGIGLSRHLLGAIEDAARDLGFITVRLDTNRTLIEARALYAKTGYVEITRYNDNPYADHFFEKTL
ncbi:MAG: GNAT family N-acetyltransferase [Rhizobiaceae bacterium]|nr:GNAT family N-acetyltransferase [Rhizobiaceae bacterium]